MPMFLGYPVFLTLLCFIFQLFKHKTMAGSSDDSSRLIALDNKNAIFAHSEDIEEYLMAICEYTRELAVIRDSEQNLNTASVFNLRDKYNTLCRTMDNFVNSTVTFQNNASFVVDNCNELSNTCDAVIVSRVKHVRTVWNTFNYDKILSKCNANVCIMNTMKEVVVKHVEQPSLDTAKKIAVATYEYARDTNRLIMHVSTIYEGARRLRTHIEDLIEEKEPASESDSDAATTSNEVEKVETPEPPSSPKKKRRMIMESPEDLSSE